MQRSPTSLEPKKAGHYLARGLAYLELRDADRAIGDFGRAIGLDPRNATALKHRARAYRVAGNSNRAVADYDAVIRLNLKDADPHLQRAFTYRELHDNAHALEDFSRTIQPTASGRSSTAIAEWCCWRCGGTTAPSRTSTRRSSSTAISRKPSSTAATSSRAPTNGSGRWLTTPERSASSRSRGLAMRALGREEEAAIDIAKAKEIEPGIGP